MVIEKREKDIKKRHYIYDEDFCYEMDEEFIPLYFVDRGKRKGRILIRYENKKLISLWSVKIYEEYRGQKFGKQLMLETFEYISKKLPNIQEIKLYVYNNNEIAIKLYKKLGFEIIETYEDSYCMRKII